MSERETEGRERGWAVMQAGRQAVRYGRCTQQDYKGPRSAPCAGSADVAGFLIRTLYFLNMRWCKGKLKSTCWHSLMSTTTTWPDTHTHTHTSAEGSVQRQCGSRTQTGKHLSNTDVDAYKHMHALSCPGRWKRWAEPHGFVVSKAHIHTPRSSIPSYTHQGAPFLSSSTLFKALPLVRHLSSHSVMLRLDEFPFTHFYPHSLSLLHFCVLFQLLYSEHMHDSPILK